MSRGPEAAGAANHQLVYLSLVRINTENQNVSVVNSTFWIRTNKEDYTCSDKEGVKGLGEFPLHCRVSLSLKSSHPYHLPT
ncbi:hypothetical protein CHARACLAT_022390 [Characodon lateralis]|uniref:Uncharacterized protein n=1 Tax=Characodon lateralis TaxID=208331 RepID=A0ABU7DL94_9TELE|nr:hypothetical protein [Characodon lateralis]